MLSRRGQRVHGEHAPLSKPETFFGVKHCPTLPNGTLRQRCGRGNAFFKTLPDYRNLCIGLQCFDLIDRKHKQPAQKTTHMESCHQRATEFPSYDCEEGCRKRLDHFLDSKHATLNMQLNFVALLRLLPFLPCSLSSVLLNKINQHALLIG